MYKAKKVDNKKKKKESTVWMNHSLTIHALKDIGWFPVLDNY